jgi:hypothetical protein
MSSEQSILYRCIVAAQPTTMGEAINKACELASDPDVCKELIGTQIHAMAMKGKSPNDFVVGFCAGLMMEVMCNPSSSVREAERIWALEGGK